MRLLFAMPLLGTALLAACTSHVDVELGAADLDGVSSVEVSLEGVDLLDEDGDLHSLDADADNPIELRSLLDGRTITLVNHAKLDDDHYVGLRLRLADSGNRVTLADGSQAELTATSAESFADIDLDVSKDETASLVATLDLRFSLRRDDDSGAYTLVQHLRGVDADLASSITGSISTDAVESSGCRQGRDDATGVAVYLFDRDADTLVDYRSGYSGPIASARVEPVDGRYTYHLAYLAGGDYTLAWTCDADDDAPDSDDDLGFEDSTTVWLEEGQSLSVDF